ncbi:vanadium-dependent haloperoxidase [Geodermatophilus aquaeductus]|uniref:PAP2 superfamily protein n=1 Tax=Geodermatophilus aquaeductus TaxID=1564161 RepID=A0A521D8S5_9ACTN|nr:vanadium-dependent haloperoxidase [Geodermatophilus aquaeductus]SMO68094.1 PAP2 superfamily protein [Geodermatophilus aquaeductus]
MRRSRTPVATPVVAAAVLAATFSSVSPAAASTEVDGASVRTWNEIAVTAIVSTTPPTPGPVGPLYLAYVHRAVHDAVQDLPHHASVPAAVAAAAHGVLVHYFPGQRGTLDERYAAELAAVPDGEAEDRGIAAGAQAAQTLIEDRRDDGLNGPALPLPTPGPGVWEPLPTEPPTTAAAASWLGTVEPFVLRSPSELRPGGPPALTSDRWARDFEEVKTLGSATSTVRTAAQTAAALFWADPPAVQSHRALRGWSVQESLDARETARLFALVNTASTDALIACADAKFHYDFWRPVGAIRRADTDGNPATVPDPAWSPLVPAPNFPDYPSNHACATTALATVVDALRGDRPFSLTVSSVRGTPPVEYPTTFTSAEQLIEEVGNARIWAGIHYRFSVEDGTAIGRAVGERVLCSDW